MARVEEIAPAADPTTHTVLVKAALARESALRPGLFGRLLHRGEPRKAILVPMDAVYRSGQIEWVRIWEEGDARIRHVRTARRHGAELEVLSGLRDGDRILP